MLSELLSRPLSIEEVRYLSQDDLREMNFSPYYPHGKQSIELFSPLSREQIYIGSQIIQRHKAELQQAGVLCASVVGSSSVGLARRQKYQCEEKRDYDELEPVGIHLKRGELVSSDLDLHLISERDKEEETVAMAQQMKNMYGLMNIHFIQSSHEAISYAISHNNILTLIKYGIWKSQIPLMGEEVLSDLRSTAEKAVSLLSKRDKDTLWYCVADLQTYEEAKRRIKEDGEEEIYLTESAVPALLEQIG